MSDNVYQPLLFCCYLLFWLPFPAAAVLGIFGNRQKRNYAVCAVCPVLAIACICVLGVNLK